MRVSLETPLGNISGYNAIYILHCVLGETDLIVNEKISQRKYGLGVDLCHL